MTEKSLSLSLSLSLSQQSSCHTHKGNHLDWVEVGVLIATPAAALTPATVRDLADSAYLARHGAFCALVVDARTCAFGWDALPWAASMAETVPIALVIGSRAGFSAQHYQAARPMAPCRIFTDLDAAVRWAHREVALHVPVQMDWCLSARH